MRTIVSSYELWCRPVVLGSAGMIHLEVAHLLRPRRGCAEEERKVSAGGDVAPTQFHEVSHELRKSTKSTDSQMFTLPSSRYDGLSIGFTNGFLVAQAADSKCV